MCNVSTLSISLALLGLAGCGAAAHPASTTLSSTSQVDKLQALALSTLRPPSPLPMAGGAVLVWELLLENPGPQEIRVARVRVGEAAFEGSALRARMKTLSDLDADALPDLRAGAVRAATDDVTRIAPGRSAVFFGWLDAKAASELPDSLRHRVMLADGSDHELVVAVRADPPRVLAAPLAGPGWISFSSPSNEGSHRRTVLRLRGAYYLPQRYAVDWGHVDSDGRLVREGGRAQVSADYVAHGAPVLAVHDGVVGSVRDGIVEQSGSDHDRAVPITLDTAAGNSVVLDIGAGHHAVYAHLAPGSITVAPGQHVREGEVLGRLGASGNATAPHLHFHLCDRPATLMCEGVPYVFSAFSAAPFEPQGKTAETARFVRSRSPLQVERELIDETRIVDFPGAAY